MCSEAGFVTNITWQDIKIRETGSCISVNANYKPPPKNPKYAAVAAHHLVALLLGSVVLVLLLHTKYTQN